MGDIAIETNVEQVCAIFDAFARDLLGVVSARSANRLIRMADVAMRRKISEIYRISSRKIEGDRFMDLKDATVGDLRASITSKGRGLPLILFNPRPSTVTKKARAKGTGVTVTIKGRNVFIPGAFIQRMPKTGHIGVFVRGAYGGKGLGRASGQVFGRFIYGLDRLPINELYTFGMSETLANEQVQDAGLDRVEEAVGSVVKREIASAARGY